MSAVFNELLADLKLAKPLAEGEWSFVPLRTTKRSSIEYLTLFEAVELGLASVCEVDRHGQVSELKAVNDGSLSLFIPDGMTLVGCKQNRVVNISMLIPPRTIAVIPVSCVEAGRWRAESATSSPSEMCDPELRCDICEQTTYSFDQTGSACADQASVWDHVQDVLRTVAAHSPTASYHAAYAKVPGPNGGEELVCPPDANGVAIIRTGQICSLDLFDKPATLQKLWPRIRRGTNIAPKGTAAVANDPEDVRRFLADCLSNPLGQYPSIGLGIQHRFVNHTSVASALVVESQVVHLSAFRKPGPPPNQPPGRPVERAPHQPWWRRPRQ